MNYQLDLVAVGNMNVPGPEVFWMDHFHEDFDLTLWVGVLRGHGHTILINTGCTTQTAHLYAITSVPDGGILGELSRLGIAPSDVTDVIVTPFQAYAIDNIDAFPHATIHLSRKGWIAFHAPRWRKHPHDIRERCIPARVLTHLVTDAWERVHLLEEEDKIYEGVRVFWTGSHHRSSIAVRVNTDKGTVILSDAMFYIENVTDMHPLGINESLEECLLAYERIKQEAEIVLPLYDPRSRSLYEMR
jgi:hypothetical protein